MEPIELEIMVNTLVVYFSWSGNNRALAEDLAKRLNADICEVVEARRRRGWTIALDLLFRRKPKILPLSCSPAVYDHIVLVAPIWASQVAHPLQTFLREMSANLPPLSFIAFCGNRTDEQGARIERQLSLLAGKRPVQIVQLPLAERVPVKERRNPGAVSKYRVTPDDTRYFEPRIKAFCESIQRK